MSNTNTKTENKFIDMSGNLMSEAIRETCEDVRAYIRRIAMNYDTYDNFEYYEGPVSDMQVDINFYFYPLFCTAKETLAATTDYIISKRQYNETIAKIVKRRDNVQRKYDHIDRKVDRRIARLEKQRVSIIGSYSCPAVGKSMYIGELEEIVNSRNLMKTSILIDDLFKNYNHNHCGCDDYSNGDCVDCQN